MKKCMMKMKERKNNMHVKIQDGGSLYGVYGKVVQLIAKNLWSMIVDIYEGTICLEH